MWVCSSWCQSDGDLNSVRFGLIRTVLYVFTEAFHQHTWWFKLTLEAVTEHTGNTAGFRAQRLPRPGLAVITLTADRKMTRYQTLTFGDGNKTYSFFFFYD